MDSVTLVLLSLFTFWSIFYWYPRRKLWAAARLIPGRPPLPLIGNALTFWCDFTELYPKLLQLHAESGKIDRIWLGNQLTVVISDPEDIRCVLGSQKIRNRDPNMALAIKPFLGNGLFSNADDIWKVHRKLITPMFHYKVLESYVEVFGAKAKILVEKLDEFADGKSYDIENKISLCALDAVCETVIGFTTESQAAGYSDLQIVHDTAAFLVYRRVVYPWQLISWLYPFTSDGRKANAIIKTIDDFNSDIISRKLAAYRKGDRRTGVVTDTGKTVTSFLDMLIDESETQGSILTEQEILDEVRTMTGAGLITTSLTMCTLLILIAIHPEWQDALFAEMADVFADDMKRPATHKDLSKMPVLERVIRETMRMFPIIPWLSREITEDVVLPSGYTLPAGSASLVVSFLVHRDAGNYPEPEKFLPDRWLPGSGINRHSYAYLPFGAGPRHCLGQKYSLFQMKSILCLLMRRYKFATDLKMQDLEKQEITFIMRLRSGSYQVKLEKRADVVGVIKP